MTPVAKKAWFWGIILLLAGLFLHAISSILLPFVVGMMVAYFLDPAADWLEKRKCSRLMATSILTLSFFLVFGLVTVALTPVLYSQFMGLMAALPGYMENLRELITPYAEQVLAYVYAQPEAETQEALNQASASVFLALKDFILGLFATGGAVLNVFTLIFLTPVVTFYMLRDWDVMVQKVDNLLPREHVDTIREQLQAINHTIAGYLRGQVNVCLVLSVYYVAALSSVGLKYAMLVGVLSGLISFVPFVGALVSLTTAMLIAYFQFGIGAIFLGVLAVYGFGLILENNILVPKLIGDKVGLHPAWVIFGMLAGGALLGFVGILISLPLTAIIGVLARFAAERYLESSFYAGPKKRGRKKATT